MTFKKALLGFTALAALAGTPAIAQDAAFSDAQKEALGGLIKEYLMENPNVIFESIEAYRAEQERIAEETATQKITEHLAYMTRADAPSVGNPNADVTVIEFFDYNCGYCKKALPDIQAAVRDDENVRVVFKEMPILGPTSKTAAQWALAAHKQGKYFEYHTALMEHAGPKEPEELEKLAAKVGLDIEQMKKDAASQEIQEDLDKVLSVGRDVGVNGTPAFIVGTTFVPGYVGEQGLKDAIAAEREKMKNDG